MKALTRLTLVLVTFGLARPAAWALPDAAATAGRLILRHNADAVVAVKAMVILKITMDQRYIPPQENKVDVTGTVISPTGLTVTSLSSIDPKALFDAIRAKLMGGGGVQLSQSETKDLKLRLGDGTEVPAKLVGKDAERDLAFLAPVSPPARPFTYVNLADAPAAAVVLADYFELSRMPEGLLRAPVVRPCAVIGIVERPRRMFLVSTDGLGCPIFDPQGHVLGISLLFLTDGVPSGKVVIPAGDIADSASQIPPL
jgi:Trypsin-like peptidase domain